MLVPLSLLLCLLVSHNSVWSSQHLWFCYIFTRYVGKKKEAIRTAITLGSVLCMKCWKREVCSGFKKGPASSELTQDTLLCLPQWKGTKVQGWRVGSSLKHHSKHKQLVCMTVEIFLWARSMILQLKIMLEKKGSLEILQDVSVTHTSYCHVS